MKWTSCCLILVALIGCAQKHQNMSEDKVQEVKAGNPGLTDFCTDEIRRLGPVAFPTDAAGGCFKMEAAKRWRGLYRYDFETSLFCPAPARQCSDPSDDAIWLSGKDSVVSWPNPNDQGSLYTVDFVGRRTAARGYHGHLGAYPYEVVVDRLIAIKRIEGPWKLQCDAKSNSCTQVR